MLLPEDWLAGKTANVMYILTVSVKTSDVTYVYLPSQMLCQSISLYANALIPKYIKKSARRLRRLLHNKEVHAVTDTPRENPLPLVPHTETLM